jgi:predicted RNase H-like HicB family nuclease
MGNVIVPSSNPLPARGGEGLPMKFYSFQIVIEKEPEDQGYFAYTPNVPGCFSNGKTIEETKRNIREAVEQHLAFMLAHAQPIPQNDRVVHVEELTVAVPE